MKRTFLVLCLLFPIFIFAQPKMTVWSVNDLHLQDHSQGKSGFWQDGDTYYMVYIQASCAPLISSVKIVNEGNEMLEISDIQANFNNGPGFSISKMPKTMSLAPGKHTILQVTFVSPSSYVPEYGFINLITNTPGQSIFELKYALGEVEACTDLFISEYVHGSGSNRCIELYNPTNQPIDLDHYFLEIVYTPNQQSSIDIDLSGVVYPYSTYVICDNGANFTRANQNLSLIFDGDDAVALTKDIPMVNGSQPFLHTALDMVGLRSVNDEECSYVFCDPGTEWGTGLTSTFENTLRRKSTITSGIVPATVNIYDCSTFNPDIEWLGFAVDDTTGLGVHESVCLTSACEGGDLFFSEYIEGNGWNKCVEIFNPTNNTVDLSSYSILRYNGGSPTRTSSVALNSVMLTPGEVYVVCDSRAGSPFDAIADQFSGTIGQTGDDDLLLLNGTDTIDVFGQIEFDPGTYWGSGDTTTMDHTLVRESWVSAGDPSTRNVFFPTIEWVIYPINDSTYIGEHTNICHPCNPREFIVEGDTLVVLCGIDTAFLSFTSDTSGMWTGGLGTFEDVSNDTTWYVPHPDEVGSSILLEYTTIDPDLCLFEKAVGQAVLSIVEPPDPEFNYGSEELCTLGVPILPEHSTGKDGAYSYVALEGGPTLNLDPLTGEIEPGGSNDGVYKITNSLSSCGNLIITGIYEGALPGSSPKAIEIYALTDIQNLSCYGMRLISNDDTQINLPAFTFPQMAISAGSYIYIADSLTNSSANQYMGGEVFTSWYV
jgi:hypothetical protein